MDLLEEKKIGKCNMSYTQYAFSMNLETNSQTSTYALRAVQILITFFVKIIFLNGTCPLGTV